MDRQCGIHPSGAQCSHEKERTDYGCARQRGAPQAYGMERERPDLKGHDYCAASFTGCSGKGKL